MVASASKERFSAEINIPADRAELVIVRNPYDNQPVRYLRNRREISITPRRLEVAVIVSQIDSQTGFLLVQNWKEAARAAYANLQGVSTPQSIQTNAKISRDYFYNQAKAWGEEAFTDLIPETKQAFKVIRLQPGYEDVDFGTALSILLRIREIKWSVPLNIEEEEILVSGQLNHEPEEQEEVAEDAVIDKDLLPVPAPIIVNNVQTGIVYERIVRQSEFPEKGSVTNFTWNAGALFWFVRVYCREYGDMDYQRFKLITPKWSEKWTMVESIKSTFSTVLAQSKKEDIEILRTTLLAARNEGISVDAFGIENSEIVNVLQQIFNLRLDIFVSLVRDIANRAARSELTFPEFKSWEQDYKPYTSIFKR